MLFALENLMKVRELTKCAAVLALVLGSQGVRAAEPQEAVLDQVTVHVSAVIPQAQIECGLEIIEDFWIDGKPGRDVVGIRLLLPSSLTQLPIKTDTVTLGGRPAEVRNASGTILAGEVMLFHRGEVQRAGAGHSPVVLEAEIGAGHRIVATEGASDPSLCWSTTTDSGSSTTTYVSSQSNTTPAASATKDVQALLLELRQARQASRRAAR